eukprot:366236-Chlamydomonas_euryale.AAC.4
MRSQPSVSFCSWPGQPHFPIKPWHRCSHRSDVNGPVPAFVLHPKEVEKVRLLAEEVLAVGRVDLGCMGAALEAWAQRHFM